MFIICIADDSPEVSVPAETQKRLPNAGSAVAALRRYETLQGS